MVLKDNLYNITSRQDGDVATTFRLRLNPSCFIYKAHFPGNPITPGVCILQTARELVEELTNRKLEISEVKNVRYFGILSPEQNGQVDFVINRIEDDGITVRSKVVAEADGVTFTTIDFVCRNA